MENIWKAELIHAGKVEGLPVELRQKQRVDTYDDQLFELHAVRNPNSRFKPVERQSAVMKINNEVGDGVWWYFPWLDIVIHLLPEKEFIELKTARNRNLITATEQEIFYNTAIGVAGLSVGSHAALTSAMNGGAKKLKLADPDSISLSNLNRIRVGVNSLGKSKAILAARLVAEINPYSSVQVFPNGLDLSNMEAFFSNQYQIGVLVEEMDNPYLKIKIREYARKLGVPVLMATDNGDNIFVDIERYDLDRNMPVLHGLLGELTADDFLNPKPEDIPRLAAMIAGAENATIRMQDSVLEVGKSLYSWPQLGTAANMCGSILAYLVRRVALKDAAIISGRYQVNIDAIFEAGYFLPENVLWRKKHTEGFFNALKLK